MSPLAIDLYCGLGGWTEGLLAEGWTVIGFDIERHVYGEHYYPAQLVLQDVLTLHGSQFKDADLIVASPPCQAYSYRAMPWSRAKALPPPDNTLFEACFRIQREASETAGRHIPLIVENVRGAQKWVGRSRWNFGSFHLWGDVPALMPMVKQRAKVPGLNWSGYGQPGYQAKGFNTTADQIVHGRKNDGGSWFNIGSPGQKVVAQNPEGRLINKRNGHASSSYLTNPAEHEYGSKGNWLEKPGPDGKRPLKGTRAHWSGSSARKAASAMIAKIPLTLSIYIARTFKPR